MRDKYYYSRPHIVHLRGGAFDVRRSMCVARALPRGAVARVDPAPPRPPCWASKGPLPCWGRRIKASHPFLLGGLGRRTRARQGWLGDSPPSAGCRSEAQTLFLTRRPPLGESARRTTADATATSNTNTTFPTSNRTHNLAEHFFGALRAPDIVTTEPPASASPGARALPRAFRHLVVQSIPGPTPAVVCVGRFRNIK